MWRSKTTLSVLTRSDLTVFQGSVPSWQVSLRIDPEAQSKYQLQNLGPVSTWENSGRIPGRSEKNSGWEERQRAAGATRLARSGQVFRQVEHTRTGSGSGRVLETVAVFEFALYSLHHFVVWVLSQHQCLLYSPLYVFHNVVNNQWPLTWQYVSSFIGLTMTQR